MDWIYNELSFSFHDHDYAEILEIRVKIRRLEKMSTNYKIFF